MKHYDVIVVGAGPAGALAATVAARHGVTVLLLEEHTKIGRPIQCTGLVSVRAWRFARVPQSVAVRSIRGVHVHSPDGSVYKLSSERVRAYVIDRDRFDQNLAERAAQAGVTVQTGRRAVQLGAYKDGTRTLIVQTPGGASEKLRASVIIAADGPHSVLACQAGLPRPHKTLLGIQALIEHRSHRSDCVEVFFGKRWAANCFAWSVPAADGTARVGVATDRMREARSCFERLRTEYHRPGRVISYQSGMIPIGPAGRTVSDGFVVIGDAAGQAKPTSGGGIYTGMLCGRIAGEVAARCALSGQTQARFLREYERCWRAKLERELSLGMRAHQILTHLSDDQIAQALKLLEISSLRKLIERVGDIDYPSRIARAIWQRPRLWKAIWPIVPAGVAQYLRSVYRATASEM